MNTLINYIAMPILSVRGQVEHRLYGDYDLRLTSGLGGATRPLLRDGGVLWTEELHQHPVTSAWWCSLLSFPRGGSKWREKSLRVPTTGRLQLS